MTRRLHAVDIRDEAASDEQQDALEGGRVMPSNLDAEGVVLSALLMGDNTALQVVTEAGLRPEHFYAHSNQLVFGGAMACAEKHGSVALVLVAGWMRDAGTLRNAGGSVYLAQLVECTPATTRVGLHVDEVIEKWRQRQRIGVMQAGAVGMRHGELSHEAARRELKAHFEGVRR